MSQLLAATDRTPFSLAGRPAGVVVAHAGQGRDVYSEQTNTTDKQDVSMDPLSSPFLFMRTDSGHEVQKEYARFTPTPLLQIHPRVPSKRQSHLLPQLSPRSLAPLPSPPSPSRHVRPSALSRFPFLFFANISLRPTRLRRDENFPSPVAES